MSRAFWFKMNKKAVLDQLPGLVIALVVVGIVLVVGFLIIAEGKDQIRSMGQACNDATATLNTSSNQCTNSSSDVVGATTAAWNGTTDTQTAMADIPGWLSIIVITVIGALLIGLVSLFRRGR